MKTASKYWWKNSFLGLVILAALTVLAGCGPAENTAASQALDGDQPDKGVQVPLTVAESGGVDGGVEADEPAYSLPSQTLVDRQGAVEVAVTPLTEASVQSGRLVFEVAMNTHSVDLSMDLAALAEIVTDSGLTLPASAWSGGSGHHVTGYLEFELPDGTSANQLAEASNWVLTIRQVDADQRVFIWELG